MGNQKKEQQRRVIVKEQRKNSRKFDLAKINHFLFFSPVFCVNQNQCDQMVRLIFNIWPDIQNPNSGKDVSISPNLVTLIFKTLIPGKMFPDL